MTKAKTSFSNSWKETGYTPFLKTKKNKNPLGTDFIILEIQAYPLRRYRFLSTARLYIFLDTEKLNRLNISGLFWAT